MVETGSQSIAKARAMGAGFYQFLVEWVWVPLTLWAARLSLVMRGYSTRQKAIDDAINALPEIRERLAKIEGYLDGKSEA